MLTRRSRAAVLATVLGAACGGGGGGGEQEPVAQLGDAQARATIVTELVITPGEWSGIARFSVVDADAGRTLGKVEGVADFDRQRYVSRLDIDRPDVAASYDVR